MNARNRFFSQDGPGDARGNRKPGGMDNSGEELIAGRQAVLETLRYGKPAAIILAAGQKGAVVDEITSLARRKQVPLKSLSREEFEQLAVQIPGHQGVAAMVPPFSYSSLENLINLARSSEREPFILMLDHLEDPQNLGAIMRTADAAGVHGLIIPERRAAGVTAAVRKVAAGAAERMPVARTGNLNRAAERLKKEGFWLYGAEADGSEPYYRADYRRPLVLVIGSEGRGLSRLLRRNCDLILSIPMPGPTGSLNVAATTAILAYAALAQREGWTG